MLTIKILSFLTNLFLQQVKLKRKSLTGTCAKHQRKVANAIKRARFMTLIPYTIVRARLMSK
ncbi:30S ribosomal protein S18 [Mycoplasmopsis cynos]|uniref:30S ribosomal protein S18 n=1 Tax=Mycoplasmopsis cynos TaxID=171284 RepID=UPI003A5C82DB